MRVQVTYWPGVDSWLDNDFIVDAGAGEWPNTLPGYHQKIISANWVDEQWNGSWLTETYEFTITPNPTWEEVWIGFENYPVYIDQVVIDTICVPEPVTILLIGLGGIFLRKNK